jgi:hypothetical protein
MSTGDSEGPAWNKFWMSMENETESMMSGEGGSHVPHTPDHRSAMMSPDLHRPDIERLDSLRLLSVLSKRLLSRSNSSRLPAVSTDSRSPHRQAWKNSSRLFRRNLAQKQMALVAPRASKTASSAAEVLQSAI